MKTEEVLLSRGFILDAEGKKLNSLFHTEQDQEYFETFLSSDGNINFEAILKDVGLNKRRNYGMSGPNDYVPKVNSRKATVPLQFLDPGIASLVKVLAVYNIYTNYSCDGHGIEIPKICFVNIDSFYKCKSLFNTLFKEYSSEIVFKNEPGFWMNYKLEFPIDQSFKVVQNISKRLLNADLQRMYHAKSFG